MQRRVVSLIIGRGERGRVARKAHDRMVRGPLHVGDLAVTAEDATESGVVHTWRLHVEGAVVLARSWQDVLELYHHLMHRRSGGMRTWDEAIADCQQQRAGYGDESTVRRAFDPLGSTHGAHGTRV